MSKPKTVTIPTEPSDALLMSMAIRYDHALAIPGYYDQPMFGGEPGTHKRKLEMMLIDMRRLHEEVVGSGFYNEAREDYYLNIKQATESK